MEPLKIRTLTPVTNADAFSKVDYYIVAELRQFDIVSQGYQVVYYKEIPNEEIPLEVRPTNGDPQLERVHFFPSLMMEASMVNYMLGIVLAVDFYANGTILENIQTAMHEIFRLKVGSDGRYGLGEESWEKMYQGVPESQLNKISISSPLAIDQLYTGDIVINTLIENSFNTTKVEFYEGVNLLGTNLVAPFNTFNWVNAPTGAYDITTKLYDNDVLVRTSDIIAINVDVLPETIAITNPMVGNETTSGEDITIDVLIENSLNTTKVEFYEGINLIGENLVAPFNQFIWSGAGVGSNDITAKLYDTDVLVATSNIVNITVYSAPEIITITNPISDEIFISGNDVVINTTIENSLNTTKVEFFEGENLLGIRFNPPFDLFTWANAPIGTYNITAKLYDTDALVSISNVVNIEVQA